jgi:rubredoxin
MNISVSLLITLTALFAVTNSFIHVRSSHRVTLSSPNALFMAASPPAPPAPADDPYLVHYCVSCQYEYDEEKGFKKRIKPGTRMRDMETFACPVCGAAKDQFKVKE